MGSKTVKFDEFDARVQQYWLPSDFDFATVSGEVAGIQQGWNGQGFIRLDFDDATQVLTGVFHRVGEGVQVVWETGEQPSAVVRQANRPNSWDEMWQTWKGWNEFCAYAETVHMSEATNFLNAVAQYRQSPGVPAQLEIYSRFIAPEAPEQVTLDNQPLIEAIEQRTDGGADVFDDAEREVVEMLRGRFAGFQAWYDGQ